MPKRHARPLPTRWLMTDERLGAGLIDAIAALPKGSGIIFRHYSLELRARRTLFGQVRAVAKRRKHCLILAGSAQLAHAWRADGAHGRNAKRHAALQTAPIHTVAERIAAERAGADLLFVSPVFATASHPNGRILGRSRFGLMIKGARTPIIALGGMTSKGARTLKNLGIYGWAGISAFKN